MTITRVQQVTGVLSGTSDSIALPAAPQYGNTLIAILARAGSVPIATSLTQTGVTWVSGPSGDNAGSVGHHFFYVQRVGPGAGTTITVARGDSDDYVVAVFEYSGLRNAGGALLDVTSTASEDGNSPYTGQTATPTNQDIELYVSAVTHVDTNTRQDLPSNQFVELEQVEEAADSAAAVMLGVYEKTVSAIDQPNMAVHTAEWVVWNTRLQTFFGSLATEYEIALPLNSYIADAFELTVAFDMPVAAIKTMAALTLNVAISPILEADLQVFIGGDGARFVDLDVSVDTTLDRRVGLDVLIEGTSEKTAVLEVNVGLGTFAQLTFLDNIIKAHDIRKTVRLDAIVLAPAVPTSVTTTPEDYRYLTCRPLWCNVPKTKQISASLSISVSGPFSISVPMDVNVQYEDWYQRASRVRTALNVSITT